MKKSPVIITVPETESGHRIDRYLTRVGPKLNFVLVQKLFRQGDVRLDGKRAKPNDRIAGGQEIRLPGFIQMELDKKTTAKDVEIPHAIVKRFKESVIFEDDELIVLNKWSGLPVQGGNKIKIHVDVISPLIWQPRPKLVHRIDRDTSGLLLMAKTAAMASQMTRAFAQKTMRKTYWAVVLGTPKMKSGIIDLPMAKKMGDDGERMEIDHESGEDAITEYRVLAQTGRHYALLELSPITGRTHQLRVHCAALNMPILGDPKYCDPNFAKNLPETLAKSPLLLHAKSIGIPNEVMGQMNFHAPLPDYFIAAMSELQLHPKDK